MFLFKMFFPYLGVDEGGDKGGDKGSDKGAGDKGVFTPEQQAKVDQIVQDRVARERAKYSDYEDLRTFKTEHQKQVDAQTLKDQEARKEYDTAKQNYEKQIKDLQGVIVQKDGSITSLQIGHALTSELSKQKGYVEESTALLAPVTVIKDGAVFIKGKDANNIETLLPVAEGVKQFLAARPHLVQASSRSGGGSSGGDANGAGGAGAAGAGDLATLNQQMAEALMAHDAKRVAELRPKLVSAVAAARRQP